MPSCAQYKWVQSINKTISQDHEFLLHTNVHFISMIFQNNNNYDNNNAKTEDNSKEKTEAENIWQLANNQNVKNPLNPKFLTVRLSTYGNRSKLGGGGVVIHADIVLFTSLHCNFCAISPFVCTKSQFVRRHIITWSCEVEQVVKKKIKTRVIGFKLNFVLDAVISCSSCIGCWYRKKEPFKSISAWG